MTRYNKTIPNLLNGMSQQAPQLRRSSQAEDQLNGLSSVINGLSKRPPLEYVSKLPDSDSTVDQAMHWIERDSEERYLLLFRRLGGGNYDIKAYDLNGIEIHVENTELNFDYLTTDSPLNKIRAVTIRDFTYIVNIDKTVEMLDASTSSQSSLSEHTAVIAIKNFQVQSLYKIKVTDANGTYTASVAFTSTPNSGTARVAEVLASDNGASDLQSVLPAGYTVTREASTIKISSADDFSVVVTGDWSGATIESWKDGGSIQTFSDVPQIAVHNMILKIEGDPDNEEHSGYYVQFQADDTSGNPSTGNWVECAEPGIANSFDATTMPHKLVRKFDTDGSVTGTINDPYFEFSTVDWSNREVGDANTNPDPSFVGTKIRGVFEFESRLGFLTEFTVVMSQTNNTTNFWRQTATLLLDDDVIDTEAPDARVVRFQWATPWDTRLILFTDLSPYILEADGILSPKTISITPLASDKVSLLAPPVLLGNNLFFASERGGHAKVSEMFVPDDVVGVRTEAITSHVQRFISSPVRDLLAADDQNLLIVIPQNATEVYTYQFEYDRRERVQAAWHRWTFPEGATPISGQFFGGVLYLILAVDGELVVEKMRFRESDINDNTVETRVYSDHRIESNRLNSFYDQTNNRTIFTLPLDLSGWAAGDLIAMTPAAGCDSLPLTAEGTTSDHGLILVQRNDSYDMSAIDALFDNNTLYGTHTTDYYANNPTHKALYVQAADNSGTPVAGAVDYLTQYLQSQEYITFAEIPGAYWTVHLMGDDLGDIPVNGVTVYEESLTFSQAYTSIP